MQPFNGTTKTRTQGCQSSYGPDWRYAASPFPRAWMSLQSTLGPSVPIPARPWDASLQLHRSPALPSVPGLASALLHPCEPAQGPGLGLGLAAILRPAHSLAGPRSTSPLPDPLMCGVNCWTGMLIQKEVMGKGELCRRPSLENLIYTGLV